MKIACCILKITFFLYLDFVELSFQGDSPPRDPQPDKLIIRLRKKPSSNPSQHDVWELSSPIKSSSNVTAISGFPRGSPYSSSSARKHPPVNSLPLARPDSPTRSSSPAEPSFRSRSRSPSARLPSSDGSGYGLDQIQFIRLTSISNPNRVFELRKYTFPADNLVEIVTGRNTYGPIPSKEQIVLSTSDGDIFAILESTDVLVGIYTYNTRIGKKGRAKINMKNGTIMPLTPDEIKDTPVGFNRKILFGYRVRMVNHNERYPAEPSLHVRSTFPTSRCMTLPTRLPSSDGSGYGLDQLRFILLTPIKNSNLVFELRKYTFPADKPLLLFQGRHRYGPIPTQEHIVLSTFYGDVFAILESTDVVVGIYTYNPRIKQKQRAKINMETGTITQLTSDEIQETPVGPNRKILRGYTVRHTAKRVNHNEESDDEASLRPRPRFPPARLPSSDGSGYELDQLKFIRLTPIRNPNMVFELRKYTFPADKTIKITTRRNAYGPVPTEEQIVLSTSAGDVFAILESANVLVGIYSCNSRTGVKSRAKINMESGTITLLTPDEVKETPVGCLRQISANFKVQHINYDLPRNTHN